MNMYILYQVDQTCDVGMTASPFFRWFNCPRRMDRKINLARDEIPNLSLQQMSTNETDDFWLRRMQIYGVLTGSLSSVLLI